MKAVTYNNVLCDEKFTQHSDQTTLEYLEAQGVKVNYHCRDGTCGACRCKLNYGSVVYTIEPLAYIRDGEILTCCSQPTSDIDITSQY
ncbi:class I ribonucleotide reductase maintenance protein YfaE [Psychrobium sp. 1_MG-2023]|uniref:class I ribonucleotide reductase maintenance protein YfaE n=1 Tax=Psychrobium sp. 1_MG-2023 TaxID=3062624 RepID=UPI000C32012C|nr:class I ribonucleotide reductase maintenance protein YfaE [Psychrobium sp. 1_MG-2023]MDP2560136.1 class I ribonucleotide reductase maintenance protein YfaE [Psychrobium sp. 1_MG-2023]PKF56949.1 2Fe-2S ferredoxin [Alteromonadales bacterium alter-6D02]